MTRKHMVILSAALALVLSAGAFGVFKLLSAPPKDLPASAQAGSPVGTQAPTQPPEASEAPAPTEAPVAVARIRAAGDIIIDTPMLEQAYSKGSYRFGKYFSRIADQLSDADLTVANIEGCLGGIGELGYSGYPSFNTPPSILSALKTCGVDMLTLANNHALDRYFNGLMGTLKSVDKAKLLRVGAYRSKKEFDKPRVIEINGIQIGFTNYTTGLNTLEEKSDKRALQYGIRTTKTANFKRDVSALRDAGAEAVVVFMHWDREYKHMPSEATRELAQRLAEAGADVVIGGHAHMVQPIEWVSAVDDEGNERRTLVAYSLGNFLSNHKGEFLDNGIIFEVGFALNADGRAEVVEPKYLPVWVWVQKNGDKRNYQVMPVGDTIDNRPEGMTDEQYARVTAAWRESCDLLGDDVAQPLRK